LSRLWPIALCLACACAAQGGIRAGSTNPQRGSGPLVWAGNVSASVDVTPWLHLGTELEGRAEDGRGSLITTGILGGYTLQSETTRLGLRADIDAGVPLAWSGARGVYLGGTFQLPIRLEAPVPPVERNRNYRVLATRLSLVPQLRFRMYRMNMDEPERFRWLPELTAGVALRVDFDTDLF